MSSYCAEVEAYQAELVAAELEALRSTESEGDEIPILVDSDDAICPCCGSEVELVYYLDGCGYRCINCEYEEV